MGVSNFPPQAYTKETLSRAFSWLQDQPLEIRKYATSPDTLIALFIRSQRLENAQAETPSAQSFRKDLQTLASELKKFEDPLENSTQTPSPTPVQPSQQAMPFPPLEAEMPTSPPVQTTDEALPPTPTVEPKAQFSEPTFPKNQSLCDLVDGKTWSMIQEVSNQLNLSSDIEALRLLVSLGYKKAKKTFQDS